MSAALQIAAMSISLPLFVSGNELAVYARDFLRPLFGGGFWRSEKAKAISAAFDRRASLPQAALTVEIHADKPGRIVALAALIHAVLRFGRGAKFGDAIIVSDTVFMVNAARSPLSIVPKPRNDMGSVIVGFADLNDDISVCVDSPGFRPSETLIPSVGASLRTFWSVILEHFLGSGLPVKFSSLSAIIENGANEILSKIRFNRHDASYAGINPVSAYHGCQNDATLGIGA
jgi:hypothetical protein